MIDQTRFIAERSQALAKMYLTRRADLIITSAGPEAALDYLVFLAEGDRQSLRQFGVSVRGSKPASNEEKVSTASTAALAALQGEGPFPYPVCLLHFTMDDDQGYWAWVAEPTIAEQEPRLVFHHEARYHKLDRASLDAVVDQVGHWYDAFFSRIAVKAS